jgi:hypothetical protein
MYVFDDQSSYMREKKLCIQFFFALKTYSYRYFEPSDEKIFILNLSFLACAPSPVVGVI